VYITRRAMSLKDCIFDSKGEKGLFTHLNFTWKDKFNIYPHLPFTDVIDINTLKGIDQGKRDFLLKTTIDYTICDKKDKPLFCIEFDGMSCGYSRYGKCIQLKKDPCRKKKLELKLKIAEQHRFPFYIISYNEKKYLFEKIHLTIVDGIIGETIANMLFPDRINDDLENSKNILSSMSNYERNEYIQDLVTSKEVELESIWNPISKEAGEIEGALINKGIISGYSYKFLSKPELPEIKNIFDIKGQENRPKMWKNIKWHGCEVSCNTPKGKVTKQAWVRNFEGMLVSPLIIVRNIAELLAFYRAATLNGIPYAKHSDTKTKYKRN
jgi:hypothetical protein